ncbi:MAG TPA: DNA polymerase Y family protein [Burkholderiales bacterium]|nr:DNA polymerase Y family protein [Burkholderiales bacterium]
MLWLALHFPSLPLQVYTRAIRNAGGAAPLAVVGTQGSQSFIVGCNDAARRRGVKAGMPPAAASALACDLRLVPRDFAAEETTLERIAAWAIQFTPAVHIAPPCTLLLEIAGSLTLFGGLKALWNIAAEGLRALGYTARIACAPTPLAAQWFARAGLPVHLRHADALRVSLPSLPVDAMDLAADALALLQNVGAKTVGDVIALPRDGIARRLGQRVLDDLDRAYGALPDPRTYHTPPSVFKAEQPLPAPAHDAGMLLFAARRMLVELCGYLTATASGAQRLTFSFEHHKREPTRVTLSLVAATRDAEHLTNVLRERLERTELAAPATAIQLSSEILLPLASSNLSLIPDAGQNEEAAAHLIEKLRARLGDDAVLGLTRHADHRPERAWRYTEPGSRDAKLGDIRSRPLWLLAQPRPLSEIDNAPCYEGRLSLLAGPERIESGWWDGNDVMRDYFVAANPVEAMLWIYREHGKAGRWFLHGFFA